MPQAHPIVVETLLRLSRSTAIRRGVLAAILPFVGVEREFPSQQFIKDDAERVYVGEYSHGLAAELLGLG